jgi:hypothetical protein
LVATYITLTLTFTLTLTLTLALNPNPKPLTLTLTLTLSNSPSWAADFFLFFLACRVVPCLCRVLPCLVLPCFCSPFSWLTFAIFFFFFSQGWQPSALLHFHRSTHFSLWRQPSDGHRGIHGMPVRPRRNRIQLYQWSGRHIGERCHAEDWCYSRGGGGGHRRRACCLRTEQLPFEVREVREVREGGAFPFVRSFVRSPQFSIWDSCALDARSPSHHILHAIVFLPHACACACACAYTSNLRPSPPPPPPPYVIVLMLRIPFTRTTHQSTRQNIRLFLTKVCMYVYMLCER